MSQNKPGLFVNDWKAKVYVNGDGVAKVQTPNSFKATVDVNAADQVNKVSKYLFGGNLNPYSYLFKSNAGAVSDLKNMSPNVLRWPGGNLSNDYYWYAKTTNDLPTDLPGTKYWLGSNPSTADATTPDYYKTLLETNSAGCICVNYSYARYGKDIKSVQNAAHIAANWVRHDKGRTPFWEIGNENFGNWQSGYEIDPALYTDGRPKFISGSLYGAHCKVFIDSMRVAAAEVGTTIYIGIQAWDDYTSWDPIQTAWNDGVFSQVRDAADFVILHNYFTPYKDNSSIPTIFGTTTKVKHMVEVISAMIKKYSLKPMPIALTEHNIQARDAGQLISFINGMHAVMVIGEGMTHGLGMAQRWSTVGYWSAPGEMGTFSFKGEPDVPEGNMRPEFYYFYYMQKNMGDMLVRSTSNNSNIVSYASTFSSGQCGITLLNKSNSEITTKINLNNFVKGNKYHQYILVGGKENGDFSGNVFVNGFGSEYLKGGPSKGYTDIKPYTTNIDGDIVVDIPPYGTIFMVVEGGGRPVFESAKTEANASIVELILSEPIAEPLSLKGLSVKANGTDEIAIVGIQKSTSNANALLLTLGRSILVADKVTISYYEGDLATNDNRKLVYFTANEVLNLLNGSSPVIVKAQTAGTKTVIASFSKDLAIENLADIELYKENPVLTKLDLVSVNLVSGNAKEVVLETVNPLFSFDKIVVKYGKTTISGVDGGKLAPFSWSVSNLLISEIPVLQSATLFENGRKMELVYNQPMGGSNGESPYFVVTSNARTVAIQSLTTSGNKIVIYFKDKFGVGERILLNYSGGNLMSEKGEFAPDIVDYEVVNDVVLVVVPEYFYDVKVKGANSSYELDVLKNEKRVFTDRTYGFTDVKDTLLNAEFIRVPNALKTDQTSVLVSFKVTNNGKLFIAHDDRLLKPSWLTNNFTKTTYSLDIGGAKASLYYKDVQKGVLIELGTNQIVGSETTSCNNYVIIFDYAKPLASAIRNQPLVLDVTVFPNPSNTDYVSVVSDLHFIDTVRIVKLDGSIVAEQRYDGLLNAIVPIGNLPNGIYVLEAYSGDKRAITKIVVNR